MKMCVAFHPDSGIACNLIFDELTGTTTIENVQDVSAIIEQNKILRNLEEKGTINGYSADIKPLASIPLIIMEQLKAEGIIFDAHRPELYDEVLSPKRYARWLNDSDNQYWRTTNAKV